VIALPTLVSGVGVRARRHVSLSGTQSVPCRELCGFLSVGQETSVSHRPPRSRSPQGGAAISQELMEALQTPQILLSTGLCFLDFFSAALGSSWDDEWAETEGSTTIKNLALNVGFFYCRALGNSLFRLIFRIYILYDLRHVGDYRICNFTLYLCVLRD